MRKKRISYRRCIDGYTAGTEELAHLEIVAAILHQLTKNLSIEEIEKSGFDTYFVDHTTGIYPIAASGVPYDMKYIVKEIPTEHNINNSVTIPE